MISKEHIEIIKEIIIESGKIALKYAASTLNVEYKSDQSPVTDADLAVSEYITSRLKFIFPNIPVICEEQHTNDTPAILTNECFWLVDPIDGTKSFIKNNADYTINIGLIKDHTPIFGIIYQPEKDLMHYTDDKNQVQISQHGQIINNIIPKNSKGSEWTMATSNNSFNDNMQEFITQYPIENIIRITSSIKLCLVAEGKADLYPKFGRTMEWDTAAGHAILLSAGGEILCGNGKPLRYGKDNFENPHFIACHKNILALYKDFEPKIFSQL